MHIVKQKAIIRLGDGFLQLLPVVLFLRFVQMAPEDNWLTVRLDLFLPGRPVPGSRSLAHRPFLPSHSVGRKKHFTLVFAPSVPVIGTEGTVARRLAGRVRRLTPFH